jgi:hypothetical protein
MRALIFCNGKGGTFHDPVRFGEMFRDGLQRLGFEVQLHQTMDCLSDAANLRSMNLIVPQWTCGRLAPEHWQNLEAAVAGGVGFGGTHGGAGDAFRDNQSYQWMVGGQFVSHPYCGEYEVRLTAEKSPITAGLPDAFPYSSEQYYMLTDPANRVLATTEYLGDAKFRQAGRPMPLPVIWTKTWGKGRVFYSALGHAAAEYETYPHVLEMTLRGFLWAAGGGS